jgi:periplasmic divalent cation tolerance protein
MPEAIQVATTTEAKADATGIAAALVEQRLAACVQVSGPITSCYRWRGRTEVAEEWLCLIKTTPQLFRRVERLIRERHAYDEPEIIATAIVAASESYLAWLREQVDAGPT